MHKHFRLGNADHIHIEINHSLSLPPLLKHHYSLAELPCPSIKSAYALGLEDFG